MEVDGSDHFPWNKGVICLVNQPLIFQGVTGNFLGKRGAISPDNHLVGGFNPFEKY